MRWLAATGLLLAACASAVDAPVTSAPLRSTVAAQTASPTAAPLAPAATDALGQVRADFDCDGHLDLLEFFDAPRPGTYLGLHTGKLARLTRSWGAIVELAFDGMPFDEPARNPLIGIADVNGDGCDDAIVNVGHGASTTFAAFFVFDGARLAEVTEDGEPAVFIYEGSVRHGTGIECRTSRGASEIVSRAASDYTSEFDWDVVERVYRWPTLTTLSLYSTATSVIRMSKAFEQPADFARYWGFTCGSLRTPGWAFTK
jgi:hypothetical protein